MEKKYSLITELLLKSSGFEGGIDRVKKKTKEIEQASKEVEGSLKGVAGSLSGVFEPIKEQAGAITGVVEGIGGAFKGLIPVMKTVKGAIVATGIGAVIVAITTAISGLVSWFKRSEEGAYTLSKAFNIIKSVVEVILDKLAKLGSAIVKLFKGDFKGAAEDAKAAFTGWGDAIDSNINKAKKLTDLEEEQEDFLITYATRKAELEAKASELALKARDEENYTIEERKKFIEEERQALKELYDLDRKKNQYEIDVLKTKQSLGYTSKEEQKELNELEAKQFELQKEYNNNLKETSKLYNSLNSQLKEFNEKLQKAREYSDEIVGGEAEKRLGETEKNILGEEFELPIPEPDKINAKLSPYNQAIQNLINLNKELAQGFKNTAEAVYSATNQMVQGLSKGAASFREYGKQVLQTIKEVISGYIAEAVAKVVMTAFKNLGNNIFTLALAPVLAASAAGLVKTTFNSLIPKFSTGGIVPGNLFSGDLVPALVNSGEMILNRAQQANLFRFINNPVQVGGEVRFEIAGEKLVGVLQNYNQRRVRGW